jgi:2-amino-4-hydroxy-6-hydroxymethyldihydropteridine diphosphokinase
MENKGAVYVGLGANLPFGALAGAELLNAALSAIGDAGVKVLRRSSFWASPALLAPGAPPQPDFVNAVAEVDPGGRDPEGLYAVLAGVEQAFGRDRRERWAPRTLDLDLIDFAGLVRTGGEGELTLPHPDAHLRAFVLLPLAELAPAWRHPIWRRPIAALLTAVDLDGVIKLPD